MSGRVAAVTAVRENGTADRLHRSGRRRSLEVGQRRHHLQARFRQAAGAIHRRCRRRSQQSQNGLGRHAASPGRATAFPSATVSINPPTAARTGPTWVCKNSERISKILVDPKDGNTVYACVPGKLWSDSDDRGVYKTTDGGKSWNKILKGGNPSTGCSMMSMSSQDPKTLYAGMWDFRRKGWTFRSGGDGPTAPSAQRALQIRRWRRDLDRLNDRIGARVLPTKPWGRIAVTTAPSNPDVVYALIESTRSALFRSADGGKTWQERDRSQMMVWRPFYFANLIVDPKDENKVYKPGGGLIVSSDGGSQFQLSGGGAHGDFHDVWIDPENTNEVITVDDGGVWYSHDAGNKWLKSQQPADRAVLSRERGHATILITCMAVCRTTAPGSAIRLIRAASPTAAGRICMAATDSSSSPIPPIRITSTRRRKAAPSHASIAYTARSPQHPAAARITAKRNCASTGTRRLRSVPMKESALYRRAIPVPVARSRPDLGPHLAGPDHQRSGEAEAGRIGRRHGGQLRSGDAYHHLLHQRIASQRQVIWVGTDDGNLQVTRDGGQELDQRSRQCSQSAESILGGVGGGQPFRRRRPPSRCSTGIASAT